jgi:glutathione S-transferase
VCGQHRDRHPEFKGYAARMSARPAFKRAAEKDAVIAAEHEAAVAGKG